ncbi:MAG: nitric oxide synthase oxygenase [Luteolibacter sp.]
MPQLSSAQLLLLAKEAWRNSSRCIGRLTWNSLELLDVRAAETSDEIFEACVEHLRYATNAGAIRSVISVFSEADPGEKGIRIWNRQLIRYAGYTTKTGSILGDPEQAGLTAKLLEMRWKPPAVPTPFDVLPLVIEQPGKRPRIYSLPGDAILEVPLVHPNFDWFEDLKLKWHAIPVISDMAMTSEKHHFTAAPFNGYYMSTEIASRNFGDERRYNMLPVIAEKMGLNRQCRQTLWKDRAVVELNTAVIHSYQKSGVSLIDHHTASSHFMQHLKNEECAGRKVPADWSWIVPPLSGSTCPVFHRYYDGPQPGPMFVEQERCY